MSTCPLCDGKRLIPENKVHFGDGKPGWLCCPACQGAGSVVILPTVKRTITIIKPYGEWRTKD